MNYKKEDINVALNNGYIYILDSKTILEFILILGVKENIPTTILKSRYIEVYLQDEKIVFDNKNIYDTFSIKPTIYEKTLATEKDNDITTEKRNLIGI